MNWYNHGGGPAEKVKTFSFDGGSLYNFGDDDIIMARLACSESCCFLRPRQSVIESAAAVLSGEK